MSETPDLTRRRWCAGLFSSVTWSLRADQADRDLASRILQDKRLAKVHQGALELLATGLRAGSGYPEVWIRDTNTFIEAALPVLPRAAMRTALLNFFELQGPEGDIVDGFVPLGKSQEPPYRTSPKVPGSVAFKNTVESDQESSLISTVRKFVDGTGDRGLLDVQVSGMAVRRRLGLALTYLFEKRWNPERHLVWGGTTVDWGDVQPEDYPATHLNAHSHRACSIYANAMLVIALQDLQQLLGDDVTGRASWAAKEQELRSSIRSHLWDAKRQKYIPHLYLDGSPFPTNFDEDAIYYHGGTTIAIEAGLLTRDEVWKALQTMRSDVRNANAGSIGLTIYPPYPEGIFKDPILQKPYTYQNGGDWCWFGARTVQQLVRYGFVIDAYREIGPMLDRILKAGDFYEWWSRDNQGRGSGAFRGGAGVMAKAIAMLQKWAGQHHG